MQKIIDMYKYVVSDDNTPLLPPTESGDNPLWYDFWTNTYFGDDTDYYQVIDRKFAQMYGDFYYYDFLETDGQSMSDTITNFRTDCFAILAKNQKRYQELYRIYLATDAQIPFDYNYDLTETYGKTKNTFTKGSESDTIGQRQDTYGQRIDTIGEITNTHNVAPFNSVTPQTESTDVSSSHNDTIGSHTDTIGSHSDTYGQRIDTSEDDEHTVTKKGNIGVQTASDVMERFVSAWSRYKFLELIFEDFCKELLMIGD